MKNYLILQYTPIFGQNKLCNKYVELKTKMFIDECPYKNCAFTCDKSEFVNSHAILYHEWDLSRDTKLLKESIELHRHHSHKLFVLYNDEADPISKKLDNIKFNWTISFRLNDEVSDCSYGCYFKKIQNDKLESNHLDRLIEKEFNSRKAQALWFVSNCYSKFRIDFANKLSKFIDLNVFGSCENVRVFRKVFNLSFDSLMGKLIYSSIRMFSRLFQMSKCSRDSLCEEMEFKRNKFYLSFESKNCSSYITEKFWRILDHNLIPGDNFDTFLSFTKMRGDKFWLKFNIKFYFPY